MLSNLFSEIFEDTQKCIICKENLNMDYYEIKESGDYKKTCISCNINKQKKFTNNDQIPDYIIDNKGVRVNYVRDMFDNIWSLEEAIKYGLLKKKL